MGDMIPQLSSLSILSTGIALQVKGQHCLDLKKTTLFSRIASPSNCHIADVVHVATGDSR